MDKERYIVKPEDITGSISGFPIEVVQWMMDEAMISPTRHSGLETAEAILSLFRENRLSGILVWRHIDKKIGVPGFCVNVIGSGDFKRFYDYYPYEKPPVPPIHIQGQSVASPDAGINFNNPSTTSLLGDPEKEKYGHRLYETAKAAMQGILSNTGSRVFSPERVSELSIMHAKELLRQIEEETENRDKL